MARPPRLLFAAYYLPWAQAIAAVRLRSIAKELARRGWQVTVVAPRPDVLPGPTDRETLAAQMEAVGARWLQTDHDWQCLLKTGGRGLPWLLGGTCRQIARWARIEQTAGWCSAAARACARLTPDDVDVVLASGPPFTAFGLARRLARRLGRPFVMDYRDLWTSNPHMDYYRTRRYERMERSLLDECAAISVVSPSMAAVLEESYGVDRGKVHVVFNGFDPAVLSGVRPHDFGHFAVVYAGTFYPPTRTPGPIMQALARLRTIAPHENWRFHYYGWATDLVSEYAAEHGVQDRVDLHGTVPREEVFSALRGAGAAIVVTSVHETASLNDQGIVTGKIFETIGLGTPALVVAPPKSDIDAVLRSTGGGRRFSGAQVEDMARFLAEVMRGAVPERKAPELYSWPHLIGKMDGLLRSAAGFPVQEPATV